MRMRQDQTFMMMKIDAASSVDGTKSNLGVGKLSNPLVRPEQVLERDRGSSIRATVGS